MDSVNLGALFRGRHQAEETSDFTDSPTNSIGDAKVLDGEALRAIVTDLADSHDGDTSLSTSHRKTPFRGNAVLESFLRRSNKNKKIGKGQRCHLDGHNNPTDDTLSLRSYWYGLMSPDVYMPIFYAVRITLLVALPLAILSRHPKTKGIFPGGVLLPLWAIVSCNYTFGEQLAFNVVTIQTAIVVMVWGTLANVWNLHHHPGAWWGSALLVTFCASLCGNLRSRRLVVLHTILILQMQHLPGGTTLIFPSKVCRDMLFAAAFAFFQCLWPIKSIAKDCDTMMAGGWKHIGRLVRTSVLACWSDDPIECVLALSHLSTEPVLATTANLPSKLFFVMYEVWESTLRLELRRERLTLMEMCMPRLHTMTDSARAMVMKRVHQTQLRHRPDTNGRLQQTTAEREAACQTDAADDAVPTFSPVRDSTEMESHEPFLKDSEASPSSEPEPLQRQGTRSILVMHDRAPLQHRARGILKPSVDTFLDALDGVLDGLGRHLNPHDTVANVPFAELREASTELRARLNEVHFEVLIKSETPVDPFLYSNFFVFHLSLAVVAERLLEYGERMQNFDRSRYKSQLQRTWEFFFYDYWRDFWAELPKRLTLATPRDVRIFKDAIKIACAYTVGAVYTQYIDPENVFYFGMAILMVTGLPTAGDTMEASVYRVTGMVCACSIAYVAVWHTQNLAGELAIALAGVFLSLLFRDRPPYALTAQYCSMILVTGLTSAGTKLVLLSRIVSNTFTVMTYYAIVVFIFPIDVLRVTYNAQVAAITQVADRFSRLVDVISHPLSIEDPEHLAALRTEVLHIHDGRVPMWNALNAVGMWLPKAAADPAPLGSPYPLQAMRDMYSSLRRLGSATDIISASLHSLFRENAPPHRPDVEHILAAVAPVMQMVDETSRVLFQDFLDALSKPHEWSPKKVTYHFSVFLSLSSALHEACWMAHRRNVKALRANFRSKVMNRTFAAAAQSDVIDQGELERARTRSFGLFDHASSEPSAQDDSSSIVFDAVDVAAPHSRPPTVHNASMGGGAAAAAHRDDATPAVTNGSIARTIAESVAMVRSTERRNSRPLRWADGGNVPEAKMVAAETKDAADVEEGKQEDEEEEKDAAEQNQCEREREEFTQALDQYEREAREEERWAFITAHGPTGSQLPQNTFSNDVNMVMTIMVGTDMFFAEAERLLKTMYAINEYARSRVPAPRKP